MNLSGWMSGGVAIALAATTSVLAQTTAPQPDPLPMGLVVLNPASSPPGAPAVFTSTTQILGPLPPPGTSSPEGNLRVLPPGPPSGAPVLTGAVRFVC